MFGWGKTTCIFCDRRVPDKDVVRLRDRKGMAICTRCYSSWEQAGRKCGVCQPNATAAHTKTSASWMISITSAGQAHATAVGMAKRPLGFLEGADLLHAMHDRSCWLVLIVLLRQLRMPEPVASAAVLSWIVARLGLWIMPMIVHWFSLRV